MSILNKYFDKIYCINLDHRTDRWEESQEYFKKYNIEVERFSAVNGRDKSKILQTMKADQGILKKRPGLLGCSLSHYGAIKKGYDNGYNNVFIFEDDFILVDNFEEELEKAIQELPEDWDMFYLGANHLSKKNFPIKVTERIYKLRGSFAAHAYAVNGKFFEKITYTLEHMDKGSDQHFSDLHKEFNCYVTWPHLAWQRAGYSDIMKGERDYKRLKNNFYTDDNV